ncbi:membrane lipoprotein lipid attachment site-containing protein [uncultured Flavobacterium sp.]|jgi:hypothetical protein|uniref:membrane lipoprotein lipid attachment site-containing protein n=1 Tax=uncultured Flavobacterium sp. TaxID=165435 RepID=UPI0025EEA3D3|nr:membrane lipoprotein lipid attachment site-containing protein [uncultured Flavobacterium sp.]
MKKILIPIFAAALLVACNDKKTDSHEGHDHGDATEQHEGHDHSGDASSAKDTLSGDAHDHEHTDGDGHQH